VTFWMIRDPAIENLLRWGGAGSEGRSSCSHPVALESGVVGRVTVCQIPPAVLNSGAELAPGSPSGAQSPSLYSREAGGCAPGLLEGAGTHEPAVVSIEGERALSSATARGERQDPRSRPVGICLGALKSILVESSRSRSRHAGVGLEQGGKGDVLVRDDIPVTDRPCRRVRLEIAVRSRTSRPRRKSSIMEDLRSALSGE